jgi:hypothetical protein
MHTLYFVHTASAHVATFQAIAEAQAPGLQVRHTVVESLLDQARAAGTVNTSIRTALGLTLQSLQADIRDVVVCTCSTLGGAAEEEGRALGLRVLRVDRPMAEAAAVLGGTCLVVACLESTLTPTVALLESCAQQAERPLTTRVLLLPHLWPLFTSEELTAFHSAIANAVVAHIAELSPEAHIQSVLLAQASMAGAAALCAPVLSVPILASPASGVAGALRLLAQ